MSDYNWQQSDWTLFRYDLSGMEVDLLHFVEKTGRLDGLTSAMTSDMRLETVISLMVEEALKTSEIEGEFFSRADIFWIRCSTLNPERNLSYSSRSKKRRFSTNFGIR